MTQKLASSSTTPLTPPRLEEDRSSWLRLFRSRRVGVSTFFRLLEAHGTARGALAALPEIAAEAGVRDYKAADTASIDAEIEAGERAGARLLCLPDPAYPPLLRQIPDPPPVLWAIGTLALAARPTVAIVGARNASSLGERMARKLAADLGAAGWVVVSGLARGIDASAHVAALDSGTIAVLAGGVDCVYPRETAELFAKIGRQGLRLSEQPMGSAPQARDFPRRNRIISGCAEALVVVEAAGRSGSLITARTALDQGREVLAVPGHPFDARASGCNMLIREGARLIRNAEDVIEALRPDAAAGTASPEAPSPALPPASRTERSWRERAALARRNLLGERTARRRGANTSAPGSAAGLAAASDPASLASGLAARILARLGPTPLAEDQLIRDLGCPAAEVAPVLLELELDGRVTRHSGGLISRAASGIAAEAH